MTNIAYTITAANNTLWIYASTLLLIMLSLPYSHARAESITIDGVTIDYSKATETSADPAQQRFIESFKAAWKDKTSTSMEHLVDVRSQCGGLTDPAKKVFFEEWFTSARGMRGVSWPRDSKLRFVWLPWKDVDLIKLSKRGLADYPAKPKFIVGITALDPKFFSKSEPNHYYQSINYFSVIDASDGNLRLAFPCLTEKGIARAKKKPMNPQEYL